jgi:hypothetical protein
MGIIIGFIPWIVYWILVGNVPFTLAVAIAFGIALLIQILQKVRRRPLHSLDIGTLVVFAVLVVAATTLPGDVLERWLQPLSNLGLFLIALGGVLLGRPFVRDYAVASVDAATAKTSGFRTITNSMTWMWVVAFGLMTAVSAIPPVVDGDATILDLNDPLSIICYWVVPYTLLGIAGAVSAVFPPWFDKKSAELDQRTATPPPVVAQAAVPADRTGVLDIAAPADSRIDEPFPVTVGGAPAGSTLRVQVGGQDLFGRRWRSRAAFTVPAGGRVDLARDTPRDGDWSGPDPGAAIWAMRFDQAGATPEMFVPPTTPWQVTVEATVEATGAAEPASRLTVGRRVGSPELRAEPVTIDSRAGRLFIPAGPAPAQGWPAVACFGGSEGGFESQLSNAATLAGHGLAALAAGWIDEADAAQSISLVPLERFGAVLRWLAGRDYVDAGRVAAMAISRGAEGLLAAVVHGAAPTPSRLVLVSPSAVAWQALGSSGEVPDTASWTRNGDPVPWVPVDSGVLMRQIVRNAWTVGRDVAHQRPSLLRLRPAYERSLAAVGLPTGRSAGSNRSAVPPIGSVLDASAVRCPLLLAAGADDELWPSEPMARMLAATRSPAADDDLVVYPRAGHLLRLGLLPTDAPWTNGIAFGGTREGLAAAQADLTARVPAFLTG